MPRFSSLTTHTEDEYVACNLHFISCMVQCEYHWFRALIVVIALVTAGCTGMLDASVDATASDGDDPSVSVDDDEVHTPGDDAVEVSVRAPLRRLTRFEYNNTVRDLFDDTTKPANALPSEQVGNGFGNDADALSVSALMAEKYESVAADVADRAVSTPGGLDRWSSCVDSLTPDSESSCARSVLTEFLPRAFRRPVDDAEVDELVGLWTILRESSSFEESMAGVFQAVLMSPDFLYRPEFGVEDPTSPTGWRPTGSEMATRLSYLFWGTTPDAELQFAAGAGELDDAEGVRAHAARMLDDPRSREMLRYFFDQLLPIRGVAQAERSGELFPDFTPEIGSLMREETHRFLEYVIFEGAGDWRTALTAGYTFLNEPLATFYGIPGVEGDEMQQVQLDTSTRRGFLTQGAFLVGTTHSNFTSPVKRGGFLVNELLCRHIPFPTGEIAEQITPPDPYTGDTARERFSQHSSDPQCSECHAAMDPAGFAFENYDAVGRWRDTENDVTIDAVVMFPGFETEVDGPTEFVEALGESEEFYNCMALSWSKFALGRSDVKDVAQGVGTEFADAEYDIKVLILALTQTDDFLYLPEPQD